MLRRETLRKREAKTRALNPAGERIVRAIKRLERYREGNRDVSGRRSKIVKEMSARDCLVRAYEPRDGVTERRSARE